MFELTPYGRRHRGDIYDPFRELNDFERSFFGRRDLFDFKTDIKDRGDRYELIADLPGFEKEDIKISADGGCLTVSAERKGEKEEKDTDGSYVYRERSYGSYSRSFDVSSVDVDGIEAEYKNGVLKLNMPKRTGSNSRSIDVK